MSHEQFMAQAITLAEQVDLSRDKNPRVGAVVVSATGEVLGSGAHLGSGTDHAEVVALAQAGELARGATVYSTLEPCAGTGKRPPCVQALIDAGVARVVFGQPDPNVEMSGGAKLLTDAGIEVNGNVLADECTALNPSWTFAHEQGRPWVIWKTATTLDGFIAAADGTSKWITGEESREFVQRIRSTAGAIVTGTGTVLADDPHLTVRALPSDQQPLRVVVGNRAIPDDANVLKAGARTLQTADDVSEVISQLWHDHSIHRVLVEAGSGLSTSLWRAGLVDEVYWFQAPAIAGDGIKALADIGVQTMGDVLRFSQTAVNRVGLDVVVHFTTRQD